MKPLTEFNQIIISFVLGLLVGPLSYNLVTFILSAVALEVWIIYFTVTWRYEARVAINCAAFIGWVLGRWLLLDTTGCEDWETVTGLVWK